MTQRRGVGLVLALLGLACLVSVAGVLAVYLLVSGEPSVARDSTLILRLGGEIGETLAEDVYRQFLWGGQPSTVRAIVESLRKAKVDARVKSVLVMPSTLEVPLWAKIQELRDAIVDFRRSGKSAIGYLEYGGDREYYLATACDRVFLMPTSPLDLKGLASYEIFLRGTLDKIGAYPDLLHIGEYKTASNQFTEKTFTPAHREMSESLNHDLYEQLVRGIAEARKKSEADVRALLDEGPFLAEEALRVGLVDDLAYEDQIDDKIATGGTEIRRIESDEYFQVSPTSLGLSRGPRISVIYAVGMINSGRSGYDPMFGPVVGSDTLVEYIREARADTSSKAIVLRVDSPGGSAVASDVIWRELRVTASDSEHKRPLVASMSDLAASGGYYIAMAADTIVAQPATLTGSIGIVSGKVVTGGTYAKLGANIEAVSHGRYAEIDSPARRYNAEERAKVVEYMQAFYDQFVEKTAEARDLTPDEVDRLAQGRVWTGLQARDLGLVDEVGGLSRALALAKEQAKIPQEAEVELVIYPRFKHLYEALVEQWGGAGEGRALSAWLGLAERRVFGAALAPVKLFRRGEPLALMPYTFLR